MASTEPRVRTGPAAAPDDRARLGEIIDGRYRLDALLGRGGMGVVYKAEHVAIRRTLAIKLLHPTLAAIPELRSRFEREAIAIGRIDHPNCVDVSDFGRLDDGTLFLVMELLEGRSLGDLMDAEAPIAVPRALMILRHVLSGLGHAHAAGIVHRDVKPENVYIVEHQGDPEFAKILDFGIAKVIGGGEIDDGVKLTQAGVAFGTPIYMSPEQAIGNPLDGRSDLYAASVMGFEMICGRPPFYSDDKLEILSMHTTRPPPSMADTLSGVLGRAAPVPPGVEALFARGLAKRKEERWPDAATYVAAIDQVLAQLAPGLVPAMGAAGPAGYRSATPLPRSAVTLPPSHPGTGMEPLVDMFGTPAMTGGDAMPGPRRPPRAALAGLILLAAAAIGVLGALALREPGGMKPLWSPSPPPAPDTVAGKAAAQLDRGDPAGAVKAIEAARKTTEKDPDAQLQLGHAYAAQRKNAEALAAYQRAVELDAGHGDDGEMRAALVAIAGDTDAPAAVAALVFMSTKLGDAAADAQLVKYASGDDLARRAAAIAVLNKLGRGDEVDWLTSYTLDLQQGELCPHRKGAVAKLRALGDPRAIAALEDSLVRIGKVAKWKGKNVNECLVDDARAAIAYLQGLPPR